MSNAWSCGPVSGSRSHPPRSTRIVGCAVVQRSVELRIGRRYPRPRRVEGHGQVTRHDRGSRRRVLLQPLAGLLVGGVERGLAVADHAGDGQHEIGQDGRRRRGQQHVADAIAAPYALLALPTHGAWRHGSPRAGQPPAGLPQAVPGPDEQDDHQRRKEPDFDVKGKESQQRRRGRREQEQLVPRSPA